MANKAKSIYLTPRSMSALRPGDALSGRVNEIIDRYLSMIEADAGHVRDQFGDGAWSVMVAALAEHPRLSVQGSRDAIWHQTGRGNGIIKTMDEGQMVVLIELLDGERIAAQQLAAD